MEVYFLRSFVRCIRILCCAGNADIPPNGNIHRGRQWTDIISPKYETLL